MVSEIMLTLLHRTASLFVSENDRRTRFGGASRKKGHIRLVVALHDSRHDCGFARRRAANALLSPSIAMPLSYLQQEAAAGLSAGILGTVIGYPLDVLKTRLQTSSNNRGLVSTGLDLARTEKWRIYRGILPPLISLSILNTTTFTLYSCFHDYVGATRNWDARNALAGGLIGPLAAVVSTVENLLKTQMQLHTYKSSLACLRTLTKKYDARVLYTGHVCNALRETTFISVYFFIYEGFRHDLTHYNPTSDTESFQKWAIPVAGGLSGAISWTVSFPLDCVRAGVQGQRLPQTWNARQVFRQLIRTRGWMGLYAGVAPSIARAFLVSGSRFSAYEMTLYLLRGGRDV